MAQTLLMASSPGASWPGPGSLPILCSSCRGGSQPLEGRSPLPASAAPGQSGPLPLPTPLPPSIALTLASLVCPQPAAPEATLPPAFQSCMLLSAHRFPGTKDELSAFSCPDVLFLLSLAALQALPSLEDPAALCGAPCWMWLCIQALAA